MGENPCLKRKKVVRKAETSELKNDGKKDKCEKNGGPPCHAP